MAASSTSSAERSTRSASARSVTSVTSAMSAASGVSSGTGPVTDRQRAQAGADEAEHDQRTLDAPAEVPEAPRRAVDRGLVPQPDERRQVGDRRVQHIDGGSPIGQLGARGGQVPEHPAGGHGQVLPHRGRLREHRREPLADGDRRRLQLGVEHGDRPALGHLGIGPGVAHDAQHMGHALRPAATLERRQARVGLAAGRDDARRLGDGLGPLGGAPQPEHRVGGAGRHRRVQVDLRQRRRDEHRDRARRADHPHVLGETGGRPTRVVTLVEDPAVAAGHHGHPVGSGDGVQADDRRRRAGPAVAERRHGGGDIVGRAAGATAASCR